MDKRIEGCLLALESIAGDIFGRAEGAMIDIGDPLQKENAEAFLRNGVIGDIEEDFTRIASLAEEGLKVVKEFKEAAGEKSR